MSQLAVGFAVVAMLAWGLWAVLANVAARSMAPELAMTISYLAAVVVAVGYVGLRVEQIAFPRDGVTVALAAGLFAGVGGIAFYAALEAGRTGIVTTISALYFVVAALLGVVLFGESLGLREVAGMGFALLAVFLLAS